MVGKEVILQGILNGTPSIAEVKRMKVSVSGNHATECIELIKDPLQDKILRYDNVWSVLNMFMVARQRWLPNEKLTKQDLWGKNHQLNMAGWRFGNNNYDPWIIISVISHFITATTHISNFLNILLAAIKELLITWKMHFPPIIIVEAFAANTRWLPATKILILSKGMQRYSHGMEKLSWSNGVCKRFHLLRSLSANIPTSLVLFGKNFRQMYVWNTQLSTHIWSVFEPFFR